MDLWIYSRFAEFDGPVSCSCHSAGHVGNDCDHPFPIDLLKILFPKDWSQFGFDLPPKQRHAFLGNVSRCVAGHGQFHPNQLDRLGPIPRRPVRLRPTHRIRIVCRLWGGAAGG